MYIFARFCGASTCISNVKFCMEGVLYQSYLELGFLHGTKFHCRVSQRPCLLLRSQGSSLGASRVVNIWLHVARVLAAVRSLAIDRCTSLISLVVDASSLIL